MGTTYVSSLINDTAVAKEFRALAGQHSLLKTPKPMDTLQLKCRDTVATFLHPDPETKESINNMSLVLKIDYKDFSVLLTGDAEKDAEEIMLNSKPISDYLPSKVLKVGHHGSQTSTSQDFLDAVSPEIAVIHVGATNRYGHPHQETIDKIAECGAALYRTDQSGNILIQSDGYTYYVATDYRPTNEEQPGRDLEKNNHSSLSVYMIRFLFPPSHLVSL